jgi:hypothetical protein
LTTWRDFSKLDGAKTDLNQVEDIFPARFFVSSGPAIPEKQLSGEKRKKEL